LDDFFGYPLAFNKLAFDMLFLLKTKTEKSHKEAYGIKLLEPDMQSESSLAEQTGALFFFCTIQLTEECSGDNGVN
jgi:hypothetical protein